MFSAGAGVFFAGAGGEKPGVCTALVSVAERYVNYCWVPYLYISSTK